MAENTVVKEQLTADMVDAGAELTRKLDELGVNPTAALWFFEPESNEWRLLFATPELATKGPREIYEKIQQAITQLASRTGAAPLAAIGLLDSNSNLIRLLQTAVPTGGDLKRIRFSRNVINGQFIDDALIYRVA